MAHVTASRFGREQQCYATTRAAQHKAARQRRARRLPIPRSSPSSVPSPSPSPVPAAPRKIAKSHGRDSLPWPLHARRILIGPALHRCQSLRGPLSSSQHRERTTPSSSNVAASTSHALAIDSHVVCPDQTPTDSRLSIASSAPVAQQAPRIH
ncbi:hypothetical protein P280DRAFT_194057 [Massarina eburnea CBS 473.64]|nr:hypothetical protein P280DRAFT_194057 [Massarina eburnea CBS 473.64]